MKKRQLIAILSFILYLNAFSQSVYVGKLENIKSTSVDSINKKIYVFFDGYFKKIDLITLKSDSTKLTIEQPFNFNNFTSLVLNNTPYFIHDGGLVYTLKNDTIQRIDHSFDHKMQSNCQIFTYNSKIYKYGGYGFWSARNMFTSFEDNLSEWSVLNPTNSIIQPMGSFGGLSKLIGNEFFIFSGRYINPNDRIGDSYFKQVWKFNMDTRVWTYLGENEPYLFLDKFIYSDYKNSSILLNPSQIEVIDILNNNLTTYKRGPSSLNINPFLNWGFIDGKFYFFSGKDDQIFLTFSDEKDFLGEKISEEPFYNNFNWLINSLAIFFSLALLVVLFLWIKRTNKKGQKIVLLENGLRFKNKLSEFDTVSMEIIRLLLSHQDVNSNTILGIVEEQQYSIAHNERLKIQKIEEINFKIKTLLGINGDVIHTRKSDKDRRIRVYSIEKNYFFDKPA